MHLLHCHPSSLACEAQPLTSKYGMLAQALHVSCVDERQLRVVSMFMDCVLLQLSSRIMAFTWLPYGPGCRRCQCPCGYGYVIIHTYGVACVERTACCRIPLKSMHGMTGLPLAERLQIWAQSYVVLRRSHHFMIVGQPASIIRLTYSCTYASLSMAHRCDIASTWVASCGQTTWQQVRPCVACACAKLAAYLPAKREPFDAL